MCCPGTVKNHIDKSIDSSLMCGKCGESVQHVVSEKLAQKEYKRRYDTVAKKVYWDLCKKYGLEHHEKWYDHIPEDATENDKN